MESTLTLLTALLITSLHLMERLQIFSHHPPCLVQALSLWRVTEVDGRRLLRHTALATRARAEREAATGRGQKRDRSAAYAAQS